MIKWNESQQKVIDSLNSDNNILVSAAAGSGKTAVLVERIIRSISEGRCNVDELLVVTFMRDAAAQMKTKIIKALEKLCADGGNPTLIKQLALADRADISTIDGFCNRVVKENFSVIGIDPSYDMYDSAESKMIHEDIISECFEKWYNSDEEFKKVAGLFIRRGFDDSNLRNVILDLFRVSQSYANEKGFFERMRTEASVDKQHISDIPWVKVVNNKIISEINLIKVNLNQLKEHFTEIAETEKDLAETAREVIGFIDSDIDYIECAMRLEDVERIREYAEQSIRTFRKKSKCQEIFGSIISYYDTIRKTIRSELKSFPNLNEVAIEMEKNKDLTFSIIKYTELFSERLLAEKIKNRRFEFGDIAHFAYRILHDEQTGGASPVAMRMRDNYRYIYIDEYQDSNYLQEEIIGSIARRDDEGYPCNVFMVGDVKQSIYRFRLAQPKLFMDKFENYRDHMIPGELINLNMNYRSRREILDGTNYIFRNIMHSDIGGIEYDIDAELNTPEEEDYNRNFPPSAEELNVGGLPELIVMNGFQDEDDSNIDEQTAGFDETEQGDDTEDDNKSGSEDFVSHEEAEAAVISEKINEIVNGNEKKGIKPLYIRNRFFNDELPESEENPRYRKAEYGDITILMSAVAGTEPMIEVFQKNGISAVLETNKGYFDAAEVMTMISVLSVIDNARIDIPYVSVLLSHIGGMTDTELALVVTRRPKRRRFMYDMCIDFSNAYIDAVDENLRNTAEKLKRINGLICSWKELKSFLSIAELIDRILADTGYDLFVSAMPQGSVRLSNLKTLRYKAEGFEKSGFTSLFDFLRYIGKCKIHEESFGDSGSSSEVGNTVRITTIHKSKGLEYPIVILARTGKNLNMREYSNQVIIDSEFGIAHDVYDMKKNGICVKKTGIKKKCMTEAMKTEDIAEHMRLLYVGMTRAQEKLIIIGRVNKAYDEINYSTKPPAAAKSFMDMLLPAIGLPDFKEHFIFSSVSEAEVIEKTFGGEDSRQLRASDEIYRILGNAVDKERENIRQNGDAEYNPYDTKYPFGAAVDTLTKSAVTKIEKAYIEKMKEAEKSTEVTEESGKPESADMKAGTEKAGYSGARRGTVVHKIIELLNFAAVDSREDFESEIDRIMKRAFFTDEDRKNLNKDMVLRFYSEDENSLFRRMKRADKEGYLYREKPFFMGMRPYDIPGTDYKKEDFGDDIVTVQGTIDAFFYEMNPDGTRGITLVDYKTDRVRSGQELVDKYIVQLYLYSISLSMITDAKINGIIFYSFALGEEVDCSAAVEEIRIKMRGDGNAEKS